MKKKREKDLIKRDHFDGRNEIIRRRWIVVTSRGICEIVPSQDFWLMFEQGKLSPRRHRDYHVTWGEERRWGGGRFSRPSDRVVLQTWLKRHRPKWRPLKLLAWKDTETPNMDVCHPRDNVPVLGLWLFSNFLGGMENKTKCREVSNKRREKKREWKKEIQTVSLHEFRSFGKQFDRRKWTFFEIYDRVINISKITQYVKFEGKNL